MRGAGVALLLGMQACTYAVTAKGRLETMDDGSTRIGSSNGESREVRLVGEAVPLLRAGGMLVEIEGTLRRGAIDVEAWRIVEGPRGLAAYVGRLLADDKRVWLELRDGAGAVTVHLGIAPLPQGALGSLVVVEGPARGPAELQAVSVTVLEPAGPLR